MGQNLVMVKLLYHKLPEGALPGQAEVEQFISVLQDQAQSQGIQMQHSLQVQRNDTSSDLNLINLFLFIKHSHYLSTLIINSHYLMLS